MKKPKLHSIKVDSTLYVFDDGARAVVAKKAKAALQRGSTVTWEDGSKQWIEINHHVDSSKRGSAVFIWNRAGEKVKADVVLTTKFPSGRLSSEVIATKFVSMD